MPLADDHEVSNPAARLDSMGLRDSMRFALLLGSILWFYGPNIVERG